MERNKLNDSMIAIMIEEEAWKELSSNYPWTEEQLSKYSNKLDWKEISGNSNIKWTASMLEKFRHSIDWHQFSRCADEEILIPEIVEKFENEWDWKELSDNSNLTLELITKYADRLDWKQLISSCYCHQELFTLDFFKTFIDYIPANEFKDSGLWRALVEMKEKEFKKQIILG